MPKSSKRKRNALLMDNISVSAQNNCVNHDVHNKNNLHGTSPSMMGSWGVWAECNNCGRKSQTYNTYTMSNEQANKLAIEDFAANHHSI